MIKKLEKCFCGRGGLEYFGIVLSEKEGLKFGNNDFERDLGKVYVREGKS